MSHHTPNAKCVNCGKVIDAASDVSKPARGPRPGDISVCLYCRHLMIYGDDIKPRDPTDAELTEIAADPDLLKAMAMLSGYDKWRENR